MLIYHGTSARHLSRIRRDGIKPRGTRKGNWKHSVDSNPNAVYLTTAYAIYFAACATEPHEKMLVLEIDTDKLNLSLMLPDEDFLAQSYRAVTRDKLSLNQLSAAFREDLFRYQSYWEASIEDLGTCCYYDTIPVEAITRAIMIDASKNAQLIMNALDPSITLVNYHIMGQHYRDLTQWAFGAEVAPVPRLSKIPATRNGITQLKI